ncbi:hypothetical protein EYR36_001761 [Pleurotus pulmonarius]|nr:hypothetical protein EYR36_008298 [Pleurotus pulmonarius]KAF4579941.1 hypothetical protein EYR36_001761 [Pleurotus pulmonarius]
MQVAASPVVSGHAGMAFSSSLSGSSSTLSSGSAPLIFDSRSSHSSSQTDYSPVLEGPKMPHGDGSKYSFNYESQQAPSYFDLDLEQPTPRSYTFNFVQPVISDPGYEAGCEGPAGGAPHKEKVTKKRPVEANKELEPVSFRYAEGEGDFDGQNVPSKGSSDPLLGLGLGMPSLVPRDEARIASQPTTVASSSRPGLQRSSTSKLRLSYLAGKIQSLAISPLVNKLHKAGLGSPKSPQTRQSPPTAPPSPQVPDALTGGLSRPPWAAHWSDSAPSIDDIPKPRLQATQLDDIPSPLLSPLQLSPTMTLDAKVNTGTQAVGHARCLTVERFFDYYSASI